MAARHSTTVFNTEQDHRIAEVERNLSSLAAHQEAQAKNVDRLGTTVEMLAHTIKESFEKVDTRIADLGKIQSQSNRPNYMALGFIFTVATFILGYYVNSTTNPLDVKIGNINSQIVSMQNQQQIFNDKAERLIKLETITNLQLDGRLK